MRFALSIQHLQVVHCQVQYIGITLTDTYTIMLYATMASHLFKLTEHFASGCPAGQNNSQNTHISNPIALCKGHLTVQSNSQRTHLSNPVILCKVDSQGYELRGSGQVINVHQKIQHDRHSICVDEHGLVAVVLRDMVQQTQSNLLKVHLPHQLYCLQKSKGKSDRGRSELREASGRCWLLVG